MEGQGARAAVDLGAQDLAAVQGKNRYLGIAGVGHFDAQRVGNHRGVHFDTRRFGQIAGSTHRRGVIKLLRSHQRIIARFVVVGVGGQGSKIKLGRVTRRSRRRRFPHKRPGCGAVGGGQGFGGRLAHVLAAIARLITDGRARTGREGTVFGIVVIEASQLKTRAFGVAFVGKGYRVFGVELNGVGDTRNGDITRVCAAAVATGCAAGGFAGSTRAHQRWIIGVFGVRNNQEPTAQEQGEK